MPLIYTFFFFGGYILLLFWGIKCFFFFFDKLKCLLNYCTLIHQIGREREAVVCLMQKSIDKGPELQIRSAVALDHLKNYIYIEADKEAHVKEVISA